MLRSEHQRADGSGGDRSGRCRHLARERVVATASERERTLITALEKRYSADPQADRSALNQAYADAMADAARADFPATSRSLPFMPMRS